MEFEAKRITIGGLMYVEMTVTNTPLGAYSHIPRSPWGHRRDPYAAVRSSPSFSDCSNVLITEPASSYSSRRGLRNLQAATTRDEHDSGSSTMLLTSYILETAFDGTKLRLSRIHASNTEMLTSHSKVRILLNYRIKYYVLSPYYD